MIQSFTATTREIDDPKLAVAEILAALKPETNLLKNSLGVISCFSEFDQMGVLQAICDALPFDCVGATTCLTAAGSDIDQVMLSLTVLTSDDCDFKALALPIGADYADTVPAALSEFMAQNNGKPALLLSYFPLINEISGDMILTAVDKATGGVPLFGTTAVDHTMSYADAKTICNGACYRESVVFGAIYGSPEITFEIASIDENKIRSQKAIITESDGNILLGVNGKTALEYLEEIGLTKAELSAGMGVLPLVVDHKDGTKPVARAVFTLTPDGHAVCGGTMPVNATLGIGRIDMYDVLQTTEKTFAPLVKPGSVILCYSCLARFLTLGASNTLEAEKLSELAGDTHYSFACSSGELCPLPDGSGVLKNYFHNYTIAFCRLS